MKKYKGAIQQRVEIKEKGFDYPEGTTLP